MQATRKGFIPVNELLEVLRFQAPKFGAELARTAYQRGLAVTQKDGTTRPIPVTATPVILDAAEIRRRAELSAKLASATLKMARRGARRRQPRACCSGRSPRSSAASPSAPGEHVPRLATTRVDFFVDRRPAARAGDQRHHPGDAGLLGHRGAHLHRGGGPALRLPREGHHALLAHNGSNALALYRALLDGYAAERRGKMPDTIALLCRRNDAQITELRYLRRALPRVRRGRGRRPPGRGLRRRRASRANGKKYDLVYRHLFVRRLEETPAPWRGGLPRARCRASKAVLLNPPASQVEVKTTFALLSQALAEPELARGARG